MSSFEQRLMKEIEFREGKISVVYSEPEDMDVVVPMRESQSPHFLQRLRDFKLIEGSDATFVAKLSGYPKPRVSLPSSSIQHCLLIHPQMVSLLKV